MSTPESAPPRPQRSQEDAAQIEVGHTTVARDTTRLLLASFFTVLAVIPIVEWVGAPRLRREGIATPWSRLSVLRAEIRSQLSLSTAGAADSHLWSRIVALNQIAMAALSGFERALEGESVVGRALRPPAQSVMSGWLGAGNERVYLGRDGWLFYRQDVEYLTGPGFLDSAAPTQPLASSTEGAALPRSGPRLAIAQFKRDLAARGIALIVMPTPVKPSVHPEKFAPGSGSPTGVLHNPTYGAFVDDLRRDGVLVFDPSAALGAARRTGSQYLATDTHWRPEAMESVAELLGTFILTHVRLPATDDPGYRIERPVVLNMGDIARMLDLPDDRTLFPLERASLRRVLQADGSLWQSARDADVLLLGDSFSNIFTLESMGWGTSAGFAEQLSYALRRPVDRLVQNDNAAFATRAMLLQDPSRLDEKRVVVYQFAERELFFGDWKVLPLPALRAGVP